MLELGIEYPQYGRVSYLLPQYRAVTLDSDFGAAVRLRVMLPDGQVAPFCKELAEATGGAARPEERDHLYAEIPD